MNQWRILKKLGKKNRKKERIADAILNLTKSGYLECSAAEREMEI